MTRIATLSSGRDGEPRHGVWPLAAQDVVVLRPRENTTLRPVHGRVWITFERPQGRPPVREDDVVLEPGERLQVEAGQTVVVSAFGRRNASFHWELPVRTRRRTAEEWGRLLASGWRPSLPALT